jgi:hypothetical protein
MTLKEIQSALLGLGYATGKVDGILGPKTVAAVKAFQKKAQTLKVDGIPGPMTTRALKTAIGSINESLPVLQSGSSAPGPRSPSLIPDKPKTPKEPSEIRPLDGSSLQGVQPSTGKQPVPNNEGKNGVSSGETGAEAHRSPQNQVSSEGHRPTTGALKPAHGAPVASEQTMNRPDPVRNAPQWAIALYESLGWSHIQAVALTANLMWESGGNRFNTIHFDAHGDRDRDGIARSHGAGQWNEKAGRYKLLTDFATRRGKEWKDPETQLLFLDHELHTTERRAGVLLRAAQNIEEAIAACIQVWRPSIPHTDKRLAIARKLMGV